MTRDAGTIPAQETRRSDYAVTRAAIRKITAARIAREVDRAIRWRDAALAAAKAGDHASVSRAESAARAHLTEAARLITLTTRPR